MLLIKGGKYMFDYYNGNLSQALVDLFPNIGLERSRFWRKCIIIFSMF